MTEVYVQHFIKYEINNSTLKHFPDFLVCNKGIIFICCPYCLVLSREQRGYKFWEGRDLSYFAVFSVANRVPDTQQMLKQYLLNEC